jgi:uncharacterized protein YcbK (DUF882 family)
VSKKKYGLYYFKDEEFECKCGCGENEMNKFFLLKLEGARQDANIPFVITSAYRCKKHNDKEGGKKTSDHLTGEGVDVEVSSGRERWCIIRTALKHGINRIGVAKTFVHLGCRGDNPQRVIWTY